MPEPIASGVILARPRRHGDMMNALAREAASILRAFRVTARATEDDVPPETDFVLILVEDGFDRSEISLPDMKDRAGSALAIAADPPEGRVAVAVARKALRGHGASLGARELVFTPEHFGVMGMESDAMRERLEALLQALALDAERLRLRREGWEEP